MKAQGALKIIKITEGNQVIISDIFCKYFKEFSSVMRPRTAKQIKHCREYQVLDMEDP